VTDLLVGSVLPQVMRHENSSVLELDGKEVSVFTPSKPREKWLRKRTHVKLRVRGCPCSSGEHCHIEGLRAVDELEGEIPALICLVVFGIPLWDVSSVNSWD